ncbi:unnamed protein product [Bemisia tabaci]|uniref:DUF1308 domain-containing protein n=1 Tax=Bemisia tabaci TaxID=7038 RepID=A0A9P0A8E4_BEMTA|nr:unnamed protein product [Bemisia tabaci]
MSCDDELRLNFEDLIQKGNRLVDALSEDQLVNIVGASKLKRKVKQEISFLTKVLQKNLMKKEHVLCSNLHHLEAVVNKIQQTSNIFAISKTFQFTDESKTVKKINVDIVTEDGTKWIKIKSRNPKAITQIATGDSSFGQKSMIDQAIEYLQCADQNPAMFQAPKICIHFAQGVEATLSNILKNMNIDVSGNIISQQLDTGSSFDELTSTSIVSHTDLQNRRSESEQISRDIQKLNLDVSTMIAYVSSLTNGGSDHLFHDPLLNQQAEWERRRPVKPILDALFQGKTLIACQNAVDDFKTIVETMAGDEETRRAQNLINSIQVVPNTPTAKAMALEKRGKIKTRSINIFGTGDSLGAMTVTANNGFIRSAQSQGMDFVTYVHESRALTENKEIRCDDERS